VGSSTMNFELNVHSHCVTLCHWAAQAAIVASDESMDVKGAAVPLVIIADPAMTVEQSSQWVVDNQPGIEGLLKVRWMGPFLLGFPCCHTAPPAEAASFVGHPASLSPCLGVSRGALCSHEISMRRVLRVWFCASWCPWCVCPS
jgi:hypothetical protein